MSDTAIKNALRAAGRKDKLPRDPESRMRRAEEQGFTEDVYHVTKSRKPITRFKPYSNLVTSGEPIDEVPGIHVGTKEAAADRFEQVITHARNWEPREPVMQTMPLKMRMSKPYLKADGTPFDEFELSSHIQDFGRKNPGEGVPGERFAKHLLDQGHDVIPYVNQFETPGSISYLVLKPENLRSRFAQFDPAKVDSPYIMKAAGGPVDHDKAIRKALLTARRQAAYGGAYGPAGYSAPLTEEELDQSQAGGDVGPGMAGPPGAPSTGDFGTDVASFAEATAPAMAGAAIGAAMGGPAGAIGGLAAASMAQGLAEATGLSAPASAPPGGIASVAGNMAQTAMGMTPNSNPLDAAMAAITGPAAPADVEDADQGAAQAAAAAAAQAAAEADNANSASEAATADAAGPGDDSGGGEGGGDGGGGGAGGDGEARGGRIYKRDDENFSKWFKNSHIVDESGNPAVLYHGTDKDIKTFDPKKVGETDHGFYGAGHYLTASPESASAYSSYKSTAAMEGKEVHPGANVMPVYARLENPYYWPKDRPAATSKEEAQKITEELKAKGHDGVIAPNEYAEGPEAKFWEVVVFTPHQIKSAVGNVGSYNPSNPDITRADGGAVDGDPFLSSQVPIEGVNGATYVSQGDLDNRIQQAANGMGYANGGEVPTEAENTYDEELRQSDPWERQAAAVRQRYANVAREPEQAQEQAWQERNWRRWPLTEGEEASQRAFREALVGSSSGGRDAIRHMVAASYTSPLVARAQEIIGGDTWNAMMGRPDSQWDLINNRLGYTALSGIDPERRYDVAKDMVRQQYEHLARTGGLNPNLPAMDPNFRVTDVGRPGQPTYGPSDFARWIETGERPDIRRQVIQKSPGYESGGKTESTGMLDAALRLASKYR